MQVRLDDVWYRNSWVMADRHYEGPCFASVFFASPTVLDLMHLDLKRSASLPGAKLMRGVDFRPFQLLAEGVLRFPQGRLPSGGGPPLDDGNLYP